MEHTKVPIRPGLSGEKTSALYDADDKMIAFNPFRSVGLVLNEIVQAVNERDPLLAQRDALVAACKKAISMLTPPGCTCGAYETIIPLLCAALALVKGEQKSDDATT